MTLNCSGRRGPSGQNFMLNGILHVVSDSTRADDRGPEEGSGLTLCVCRSSSPRIAPGHCGSLGASLNYHQFLETAYPIVNPVVDGLFSWSEAKSHEGQGDLSLNLLKEESFKARATGGHAQNFQCKFGRDRVKGTDWAADKALSVKEQL